MRKNRKILFVILMSVIIILGLVVAWLVGRESTIKHNTETVKTEKVAHSNKAKKTDEVNVNPESKTNTEIQPSKSSSENNPNEVFGQQLNNNDFLVLAYCKKWQYSLNDFLSTANENNNACLDQDSDAGDFHGVSICQGTGDSLCELTSINSNTITISGGNPVAQSDFHNLVYNKQDLVNEFLHSATDVQTLKQLTSRLISNNQQAKQEAENNEDSNNDDNNIDNEAYHPNSNNMLNDYSI